MKRISAFLAASVALAPAAPSFADEPVFSAVPTILVRSPNPAGLAGFYEALGFKKVRISGNGGVIFHLDGQVGSLEVVKMDPGRKPVLGKTSRTQQGVVAIFETTDQEDVVRRAREAGATVIETWTSTTNPPVTIYYIGDPENNILGFAPRHHNASLKAP